jgi:hypothetical protein
MTRINMHPAAARAAVRPAWPSRYVVRLAVSSISTLSGLISFVLIAPAVYRIAAIDPALETFYCALLAGWFGSLGRMWYLTCRDRNRQ